MTCQLKQWRSDADDQKEIKAASPDVAKTRTLLRGETLGSIAAQEYNDPTLWRPIAEANGIDNPRRLTPGQVLAIPPLPPGTTSRR
jgi:nucleoid-associated protein YgaU